MRKAALTAGILLGCSLSITACSSKTEEGAGDSKLQQAQSGEMGKTADGQGEKKTEGGLTLGETAEIMVETAMQYGNRIEKETLLKNLDDRVGETADRLDMLVVVSRAFGILPEPEKSKKQKEDADISSVPEWAMQDVENLKNAGALKKSDIEVMNDPVLKEDLEAMVQRVMKLYGN